MHKQNLLGIASWHNYKYQGFRLILTTIDNLVSNLKK